MWFLLPGLIVLYYFTIKGGAYGSSPAEGAAAGDLALCDRVFIDGAQRLVYKPEHRAGVLNALLTKGIVPKPAGADMHTHVIQELGQLAMGDTSAYLFAMVAHAQAGGPQIWVTPTLTNAKGQAVRFLYWGDKAPPTATPMALLVSQGEPWPGKPPVAALPMQDGSTYPIV